MRQKPSWEHAPTWAHYLAWDKYGWGWYETAPVFRGDCWHCVGKSAVAVTNPINVFDTLEERPT